MNKIVTDILKSPVPKGLTSEKTKELIRKVEEIDLNSKLVYSAKGEKILQELDQYGVKDIPQNYRGVLLEHWLELLSQTQENVTELPQYEAQNSTTSFDLETKIENAEKLKQKNEEIRSKEKEAVAKFKEAGEKRYHDQKKADEYKQKILDQRIQDAIRNKKIVVIPTEQISTVTLNDNAKQTILTFSKVAKEDPQTLEKFVETKIKESLAQATDEYKENITPEIITKSATSVTENFIALPTYTNISEIPRQIPVMHPASPFVALTLLNDAKLKGLIPDEEVRQKVVQMSQTLALGLEAEANINFASTKAIFNSEEIASVFYGPADGHITQFGIAENQESQKDEGVEVSVEGVYKEGKRFYEFYEKIKSARTAQEVTSTAMTYAPMYSPNAYTGVTVKSASTLTKALPAIGTVYGFRQGTLLSHWAKYNTPLLTGGGSVPFLTAGGIQNTVLMSNGLSSKILFSKNFAAGYSVQVMQFAKGTNTLYTAGATFGNKAFGVYIGQASGKVGAGTIAVKATGQVAVKALPAAVASKIGAFLGAAGGWVGIAIGFVGGELIGKIIEKYGPQIKKWFQENKEVFVGLAAGGGLLVGGPVVGGVVLFGGLAAAGMLGTFAAGAFGVLGFIGRSIGIAIATPVIVTLLVIPPLVAFIMLVINNSAYVVPPGNSLNEIGADNPYMLVTKIASPNKIDNPTSPQQVIYGVSIKALKESLFNVRITAVKCTVLKKDGRKLVCPDEDIPPLAEGKSISPSQVHAFSFISRYDARFDDSLVMDSIEVTAELADGTTITTSGSASLCIGECPSNCAKTVDLADKWPPSIKAKADAGIAIMSQYFGFTAKACPNNKPINLCYKPSEINEGLYAWHIHHEDSGDKCDVYFNSGPFGSNRNENDAAFIITHELTHHVQRINFLQFGLYMISGANNELRGQGICTYSSTVGNSIGQQQEAMAESAALYVNSKPSWDTCATNYSSKYPKSYNWAKKFMEE